MADAPLAVAPGGARLSIESVAANALPSDALQCIASFRLQRRRDARAARESCQDARNESKRAEYDADGPLADAAASMDDVLNDHRANAVELGDDSIKWNASHVSNDCIHVCGVFVGWKDVSKNVVAWKSHGNQKVAKVHRAFVNIFQHWASTVQHRNVPGVSGKKACPSPPKAERLCFLANTCLCDKRGNQAVVLSYT